MTMKQATERATQLGLSAWMAQAAVVGGEAGESGALKCVGFASIDFPLGEGETWEEAFRQAVRRIFSAR